MSGAGQTHRNAVVARATTRYGTDRFPHSPFWLVTVDWPNERCPKCERELPPEMRVAFDEDEQACFCIGCARRWLDDRDDDETPAARQHSRPKTWRPSPAEPF